MNVNDIITSGAKPMLFLDYFATSVLDVHVAEEVIKGISKGCRKSGCVLIGGETAEMPGFFNPGEYDIAGFAVGTLAKHNMITRDNIQKGDVVLGFPSSGVHSNGFSLVRKVLETSHTSLGELTPWSDLSFGEELLTPTRIYVKDLLGLHEHVGVKAAAHITGGGLTENIPRMFKEDGKGVVINTRTWEMPNIFHWLQQTGNISDKEMRRVFNLGIGMAVIVDKNSVEDALKYNKELHVIGEVVNREGVTYL
jgi:phosphoribosylformylglycinamidine cyclo-ligase